MLTDEVTAAIARFFENGLGPSHDELTRLIDRAGLSEVDPRREDPVAGKMKRVRAVLWHASANDLAAGEGLVTALLGALRASGGFRPSEPNYPGESVVRSLQAAMDGEGLSLSDDGIPRPKSMEGLDGADLTAALRAYVRRARTSGDDAALAVGTAKDLAEATARHVLVERVGQYPMHGNFPATLWQAYSALDLSPPPQDATSIALDGDAWENVEQAIFLLAVAVNRFRNEEGVGHGRPHPSLASDEQGRIAAEASALVAELLLDALA